MITGAVAIGIVAVLFAEASDATAVLFDHYVRRLPWLPLLTTPLGFMALVWLTRRYVPLARTPIVWWLHWLADKTQKTKTRAEVEQGFWGKLVNRVMKRPAAFAVPIIIVSRSTTCSTP